MAQLIFSRIGARIGQAILPNGVNFLGAQISGAQIGQAAGLYLGSGFAPGREGPRIESIPIMESRDGAGVPSVYGRMRVPGQLIWASRFKERARDRRTAGKGSPRYREYRYSVSFAVALCEGEISRVGQVWANGEPMDLAGINWRLYTGTGDQLPDPLIETIEGAGQTPAYRNTAYMVFEDLPLEEYGNRLPQLSFEVFRKPPSESAGTELRDLIKGVNIIPASGEFAYETEIIRTRQFPGIEVPQNVNSGQGDADFKVSLDQLEADLPNVQRAALTIGWFGDDLRAGQCKIRPGVEIDDKMTVPETWRAGGVERSGAYLISQSATGHANYGGTPSDASIIRALRDLSSRGIQPTVTPFLFMDVPVGNSLPDPYGSAEQAAFPWRGRITGSAADVAAFLGTAALSDFQIVGERVDYTGDAGDWGYRRFVLHLAHLAKIAGGVEAFLIGSEMVALSRVQAADGTFPFVEGLVALAADVKSLLGANVKVSYAADWTEYGAYASGSDVYFPLDKLWASPDVDFVGVDWYPPMADWRDGAEHLDAANFTGPEDTSYLAANIEGGEGYDWYYASDTDRADQVRTQIIDTAHGEQWVFRQKDLSNWWTNAHHERPGGVRANTPTDWLPTSKPVRLMEIGFPAVDKGANSPNLFFDPKSSESALPPFSDGTRNDLQQRRALETALAYWQSQFMVEAAYVWCWDARPYPAFPARDDIWSDGENWQFGHWLNGRVGGSELGDIVRDICARGGVDVDTSQLRGLLEGYSLSGVYRVRDALEPLRSAGGFDLIERGGALVFVSREPAAVTQINQADIASESLSTTRRLLDKRPGEFRLAFVSSDGSYAPATAQVRDLRGDRGMVVSASVPVIMDDPQAELLTQQLLQRALKGDVAEIAVPIKHLGIEPGDTIQIGEDGAEWRVDEIEDVGLLRRLSLSEYVTPSPNITASTPSRDTPSAVVFGAPELLVIDALEELPLVAAAGTPWPRRVSVQAGPSAEFMTERAEITIPASMGLVQSKIFAQPIGRWDRASELVIYMPGAALSSETEASVMLGANRLLVEAADGWELIGYCSAELIDKDTHRLSGLLRGLRGTKASQIEAGARCVVLDSAVEAASLPAEQIGTELQWQAVSDLVAGPLQAETFVSKGALAYRPGHLRAHWQGDDLHINWTRRGKDVPESWALPEVENTGQFDIVLSGDAGNLGSWLSDTASITLTPPPDAKWVKVAEIGPDGRRGAEAVLLIPGTSA